MRSYSDCSVRISVGGRIRGGTTKTVVIVRMASPTSEISSQASGLLIHYSKDFKKEHRRKLKRKCVEKIDYKRYNSDDRNITIIILLI